MKHIKIYEEFSRSSENKEKIRKALKDISKKAGFDSIEEYEEYLSKRTKKEKIESAIKDVEKNIKSKKI